MTAGGVRRLVLDVLVPDVQVPDVLGPDVLGHEALAPGARGDTASAGKGREDGRIMLLTSAFVAFALLLVTVVVSATEVHLERKRLYELADALALAAADSMTHETFYTGAATAPVDGAVLTLTSGGVRAEVTDYLARNPEALAGLHGVTVTDASTTDGRTATVSLAARARPAMVSWVTQPWSDGIIIRAESRARAW
ncbi:putative Flp pilus-assembly TadE/G-like protein [Cellulosimicrobium cellulans J34]|nr:putative Flp pilus-assembly TadE/G-like protein [Cellulosimicrobium cellulans J34]SMF48211.1 Putative Flp pilus-assembly TadE/G-like [Cellulosimicrobium cellulans J1]